jgi:valyl-tRNA synthetase
MDKAYNPKETEKRIYDLWENGKYFAPSEDITKPPFTIVLPPPNANADLHLGHAMYVIEDIMIRYHRMLGDAALWFSGADHAGFETQFVFEKHLAKQGKSRFDYSREDLYKAIWDFVQTNRGTMENQLKRLGFSLDWTRRAFPLDPGIVSVVYKTFKKLHDDKLIYRGQRLVNYCTRCGTGFSDLEVKHIEQVDPLYYIKYGPFVLATVRPETKFGDTAIAVHPNDKRYKKWIGKDIEFDGLIGKVKLQVVADEAVDPKFGTGVVKVTPAHDPTDYEIGIRHNLPSKQIIGFDGKLTELAGPYAGLRVKAARVKVVEDLKAHGLIDHVDEQYLHTVGVCYKCNTVLEPLPLKQWFITVRPLADTAIDAIKKKKIVFVPKRFEKLATLWLTNFHDWNISRQIVWGIRIPAWICETCTQSKDEEHAWIITDGDIPKECPKCHGTRLTQDPDTFDTWFSSGQWPFATLQASGHDGDFKRFYPTSVMETGYDILPWWVCRMMMLGLYATGDVPFKTVYLHGIVRDNKGQKMSKSKGNVINPLVMMDQYGTDALRFSLIFGTAAGNDQSLSEDKIRGMRNFANKLWNITRLFTLNHDEWKKVHSEALPFFDETVEKNLLPIDRKIIEELQTLIVSITKHMNHYRFADAAQELYDFIWHQFADVYLEANKERYKKNDTEALIVFRLILFMCLKLLHPFMPFITEELYQKIPGWNGVPLIISPWPKTLKQT